MAITRGPGIIYKQAVDAKPTASLEVSGIELRNTDDYKKWINSGTEWILQERPAIMTYDVFKEGTTYYIVNQHGKVEQSNSDMQAAVQAQLNAQVANTLANYYWDGDNFQQNAAIVIPSTLASARKMVRFYGGAYAMARFTTPGATTTLSTTTSMPTGRYCIECNNPIGSVTVCDFQIRGFSANNVANIGVKNIMFLKLETDSSSRHLYEAHDIFTQYMFRSLVLFGGVWWSRFSNWNMVDQNDTFSGDVDVLLGQAGHSDVSNPVPKLNYFENMVCYHDGEMDCALEINSGGYNKFFDFNVHGDAYRTAVVSLNNTDALKIHNNRFWNVHISDTNTIPSPDNRIACIYLNGAVYDNMFFGSNTTPYPIHVRANGANCVNNYLQLAGQYIHLPITIDDTGSGVEGNEYELIAGNTIAGTAIVKATHTGGIGRIIDKRKGAKKKGAKANHTDGANIAHGLFDTPLWYWVQATVVGEIATVTSVNATNLVVALKKISDGLAGTSQTVIWGAGVYA